jgi:flavin-binding protein dodecin
MHMPMDEQQRRLLQKMALHQFGGMYSACGESFSDSPVMDLEEALSERHRQKIFSDVQKLEDCALEALNAVEQYGLNDPRVDQAALRCGIMCRWYTRRDVEEKHEDYRHALSKKTFKRIEQLGVGHPDLTDAIADAVALWVRNPKKGLSVNSLYIAQQKYLDLQDDVTLKKASELGVSDPSVVEGISRGLSRNSMTLDHLAYAQKCFLRKQQRATAYSANAE